MVKGKSLSRRFIFVLLIGLITIFTGELIVRGFGYKAGLTSNAINGFHVVDSLVNSNYYVGNEIGLFVANVDCTSYFPPLTPDGFLAPNRECEEDVIFIGDSFLWGAGASDQGHSFYSKIGCGWNLGIPGADLSQYKLIAEKYAGNGQYKKVILTFFMGNDIIKFERIPRPFQPIFYTTNAGNLMAFSNGEYLSPKESYDLAYNNFVVSDRSVFGAIASRSAILTLCFYAIPQWRNTIANYDSGDYTLTNTYLKQIKTTVENGGAEFFLFIIPSENDLEYSERYDSLFQGLDYYWPTGLSKTDYEKTAHFNDQGHRKFADFIMGKIN